MFNFPFPIYLVGGAVRDKLLGNKINDLDYVVVHDSFDEVVRAVEYLGGVVYVASPEFLTLRCRLPELGDVDIALARFDGEYEDGRRPSSTSSANSIIDDLARRDFTINAIAQRVPSGEIVDPFDGRGDIKEGLLRCVGDPESRLREDALRGFRLLRFSITLQFEIERQTLNALQSLDVESFSGVATERIQKELDKTLRVDPFMTFHLMNNQMSVLGDVVKLREELRFVTTTKK